MPEIRVQRTNPPHASDSSGSEWKNQEPSGKGRKNSRTENILLVAKSPMLLFYSTGKWPYYIHLEGSIQKAQMSLKPFRIYANPKSVF